MLDLTKTQLEKNTHSVSNMTGKTNLSTYIFNDEIVRRLTLALAC